MKRLILSLMLMPVLSWGQKFAEMTPDRIYSRQVLDGTIYFSIKDTTIFSWNNAKGSLRAIFLQNDNHTPYSNSSKEQNIGKYSFAYGTNNIASGTNSLAGGTKNIASGVNSVAIGNFSEASAGNTAAFGFNAKATAGGAIAFSDGQAKAGNSVAFSGGIAESVGSLTFLNGRTTNAGALAIGENAISSELYSAAIGRNITSNSRYCLVVGQFNDASINATGQDDAGSPRFVVGTGYSNAAKANGFVVFQSGDAVHNGSVGIKTTSTPRASLDIVATDAIIVPVGTDAQRPTTPTVGMIRYNSTSQKYEGYIPTGWVVLH